MRGIEYSKIEFLKGLVTSQLANMFSTFFMIFSVKHNEYLNKGEVKD